MAISGFQALRQARTPLGGGRGDRPATEGSLQILGRVRYLLRLQVPVKKVTNAPVVTSNPDGSNPKPPGADGNTATPPSAGGGNTVTLPPSNPGVDGAEVAGSRTTYIIQGPPPKIPGRKRPSYPFRAGWDRRVMARTRIRISDLSLGGQLPYQISHTLNTKAAMLVHVTNIS
ncbi:hypothetical protein PoB_000994500 [Plakobranchus ocellatus]|uniref:Uncharacterized protein n=1 Tax=Plakobranchus ocellatus TaxID=259542 RepID=A0AAV3YLT1_9GAST|nr:hypothetical protein PoB_000994500 [Plakobranchus ocellatus]